jgi:hypothetical protein
MSVKLSSPIAPAAFHFDVKQAKHIDCSHLLAVEMNPRNRFDFLPVSVGVS